MSTSDILSNTEEKCTTSNEPSRFEYDRSQAKENIRLLNFIESEPGLTIRCTLEEIVLPSAASDVTTSPDSPALSDLSYSSDSSGTSELSGTSDLSKILDSFTRETALPSADVERVVYFAVSYC